MQNTIEAKPLTRSLKGEFLYKGEVEIITDQDRRTSISAPLKDMLGASTDATKRVVAG